MGSRVLLAQTNVLDVWVAVVTTAGVIGAALAPLIVAMLRRTGRLEEQTRRTFEAVGEPNGNGTSNDMLARLLGMVAEVLHWNREHDLRDDVRFQEVRQRLERLEGGERR